MFKNLSPKSIIHLSKMLVYTITLLVLVPSCLSDSEFVNKEADVLEFSLPDSVQQTTPLITNNEIYIYYIKDALKTKKKYPLAIKLTNGATMSISLDSIDLAKDDSLAFVVTAQDQSYSKKYVIYLEETTLTLKHNFDDWTFLAKYQEPKNGVWATPNKAVNTLNLFLNPKIAYPVDTAHTAQSGYAARMTTIKTNGGSMLGVPIPTLVPGSMFIGTFTLKITNPLTGTLFGQLFGSQPTRVKGFYKYKASTDIVAPTGFDVQNFADSCSLEAYFYDAGIDGKNILDGTNIKTSPNLVARARLIKPDTQGAGLHEFDLKLVYSQKPNFAKSRYRLAVLFAASHRGDDFVGGNGSVLIVDDVEIFTIKE